MSENFVRKSAIPGYRIHQRIGEGGMGEVFLATQLSLNRLVVVKYLKPKSASEVASLTLRFDREASLMSEVSHPQIVTVFDRGTVEGQPYLVMEYIKGENLRQRLQPGTPMHDAVVLGRDSPIGCDSMPKAIKILQPTEFEHIELAPDDGVISDILVRSSGTPSAAPLRYQGHSKRGPKQNDGATSITA